MGKIIVVLTILGLVFLFFAGFDALEEYLSELENAGQSETASIGKVDIIRISELAVLEVPHLRISA